MDAATRDEHDSLGSVTVPLDAHYGAQTERGRQDFDVSGQSVGDFPGYGRAIVEVRKAAALANADNGVLRPPLAGAICRAAGDNHVNHAGADGPDRLPGVRQRHGRHARRRGCRAGLQRLDGVIAKNLDRLRGDRRQYLPRSEALPWWEDIAELLTQVLVETAPERSRRNGHRSIMPASPMPRK